jgi:hypothetical protein
MSYKIERLQDLPALLLSFSDDVSFLVSMGDASEEFHKILEAAETPLYCIVDFRKVQMSFNDIMAGVQHGTKGSQNMKHRNNKQLIILSESKAIATVAKGLNSVTFGNINAIVLPSLEEAIAYIQASAA